MDWLFSGEESPAFTNDAKETTETTAATSSKAATITKNLKFARSSRMIRRLSSFEWFVLAQAHFIRIECFWRDERALSAFP